MIPITFLSDYGHRDEFAGVCRAVIARIAPGARVVDLTHGIEPGAIRQGALALANALPYAAPGVHLAVVDPGVGSERRPVAVRTGEDRLLVGPDNGLLAPALERLGGAAEAVDLSTSPFRLEPLSATFHGRDLFAPVAARLALDATLGEAGEPIDPGSLTTLELPTPDIEANRLVAHVVHLDRYGNATLDATVGDLDAGPLAGAKAVEVSVGRATAPARLGRAFADVEPGELLLYEDSSRTLALAVNQGSAAELFGLEPDLEVVLAPGL